MTLYVQRRISVAVCLCCFAVFLYLAFFFLRGDYADISALATSLRGKGWNVSTVKDSDMPPSRCLVVASTAEQDTTWVETQLGSEPGLSARVYVVNDASSKFSVPLNKGHEAMV